MWLFNCKLLCYSLLTMFIIWLLTLSAVKCCTGNVKTLYYHNYIIWPETTLGAPIETDRPKNRQCVLIEANPWVVNMSPFTLPTFIANLKEMQLWRTFY